MNRLLESIDELCCLLLSNHFRIHWRM